MSHATTNNNQELVILVDQNDVPIGTAEKLIAHQQNLLHRAFSVFIFRRNNQNEWEVLLQQRASKKYHSPDLWTNTCCSHPRPGEIILTAAARRLNEELGLTTSLKTIGNFIYQAKFPNGLAENEYDHVLIGEINFTTPIVMNEDEVQNISWLTHDALQLDYKKNREQFTPWFMQAYELAYQAVTK